MKLRNKLGVPKITQWFRTVQCLKKQDEKAEEEGRKIRSIFFFACVSGVGAALYYYYCVASPDDNTKVVLMLKSNTNGIRLFSTALYSLKLNTETICFCFKIYHI